MNKIMMNIKYKMGIQFPWALFALGIYIVTLFLTFYLLIKFSLINESEGSLVYRLWGLIIFQFAISMRFKEDFDFLLTLSNTRHEIYQSLLGVTIFFSVFFSGLIVLERLVVDYLNTVFQLFNVTDPFHFVSPYGTDNLFLQFLFFFMLCACLSVFGILMGSLFYRLGKKFTLAFWLVFSAVPTILFPMFLWVFYQQGLLSEYFSAMGAFLRYFDLLSASGGLFILTIAFGIAGYLNIRRLPQK